MQLIPAPHVHGTSLHEIQAPCKQSCDKLAQTSQDVIQHLGLLHQKTSW